MKKRNVIICFNPRNVKGNTVIPATIVREFAYDGKNSELSQEKKLHGTVTIKDLERYRDFFNQYNVQIEIIHSLLSKYQAKVTVKGKLIEVACRGDRWRILPIDMDQVLLQHNNYTEGFYGERYYDEGYHTQRKSSFTDALKYIMKYNYKRKHCPKKIIQKEFKKALTDSLARRYEAVFESKEVKRNM